MLLSRSCAIVNLKNVLMQRKALKDFSAEHEVAGIVARIEVDLPTSRASIEKYRSEKIKVHDANENRARRYW